MKFDFLSSKKYLLLIGIICVVFIIIIYKAFDYLPKKDLEPITPINSTKYEEQTQEDYNIEEDSEETEYDNEEDLEEDVEDNIETQTLEKKPTEPLEPIEELNNISPIETGNSDENNVVLLFDSAQKLTKSKNYKAAILEYSKIIQKSTDKETQAKAYEEMAHVNAIQKRYGTAIAQVQKAYMMSPSSSKEFLLARLYYKIGDKEKAQERIDNILNREFAEDR